MRRLVICLLVELLLICTIQAQEYTGITGMIHVPTAEMAPEGDARIGVSFLNREFMSDRFIFEGEKYHSFNHYLAITPFSWLELAYTCLLLKGHKNHDGNLPVGYYEKDRYFAVKLRPLKEGMYWPAVAIGVQDPSNSVSYEEGKDNTYVNNYYIAATKHWRPGGHDLGFHLTYRYYRSDHNRKWNGVVGGVTYRPAFASNCRAMVEYTGNDVNVGVDCLLWKHLFIQAALQNGRYFSGGLRFQMNLF